MKVKTVEEYAHTRSQLLQVIDCKHEVGKKEAVRNATELVRYIF